ncbi:MAG: threonine synthase [Candidatus Marinimicrobia bacterium]|nr:threonine synthase [Candidatus Neomarinimicrobiota bacterium]
MKNIWKTDAKATKYFSTNGKSKDVSFKEALFRGQAPDLGLYMPIEVPLLEKDLINDFVNMRYIEIAFFILNNFIDIPQIDFYRILQDAYNFQIKFERVYDRKFIMRLDGGPTFSFKDFGARTMAKIMEYYLRNENKEITILTATSGDTGSAVANAFHNVEGINVVVLFPEDEVSDIQRVQMTTLGDNIFPLAVDGKFDDCQAIVKRAFADSDLSELNLSSANSINVGRLLPQMVYYFYAYSQLAEKDEKIVFSVPSGNFGNMVAGVMAMKMKLPISKIVVATNENDEFPKFLNGGIYKPIVPSKACISNAMNVGHPSNLARLVRIYNGRMNEKGKFIYEPNINEMKKDLFSVSVSDTETKQTMRKFYKKYNSILEPHGAVAWNGLERYLEKEEADLCVSLETAHPSKFPEEIGKIIKIKPDIAKPIYDILTNKEYYDKLPNNYDKFKNALLEMF